MDFNIPIKLAFRMAVSVLGALLVAPWILLAVVSMACRQVRAARRAYRAGRVALADNARCPRGHLSELHGVFECRCGALFAGWAFEECPVCSESCGYVPCVRCGLSVRNPLIVALERDR
jgi:hypothetical protein